MPNGIVLWKRWADLQRRKPDVIAELPVAESSDPDNREFTTTHEGWLFEYRYRWQIAPADGAFRLTEYASVSKGWYVLLATSILGMCIGLVGVPASSPQVSVFGTLLALLGFVGAASVLLMRESPVAHLFESGEDHRHLMPLVTLFVPMLVLLWVMGSADGIVRLLAIAGIAGLLVVYERRQSWMVTQSYRWQRWFVSRMKQFPLIAANYVAGLVLGSMWLAVFLVLHDGIMTLAFLLRWPVLFPLVLGAVILLSLWQFGQTLSGAWKFETSNFQQHGRNIERPHALGVTSLVVIGMSLAFGFLSYRFLVEAVTFLRTFESVGAYWLVFVTGTPLWYFVGGFLYQLGSFAWAVGTLLRATEQRELDHVLAVDATTHVVDYDGLFAGAISLLDDHVLVSRGMLEQLSDEELAAVLAHEEGHVEHGETRLGLAIAVLSPLVLTGRNVLYGVFDFRRREFRADSYAASRLGDERPVVSMLDSLQERKAESSTEGTVRSATPTLVSLETTEAEDQSPLERAFGFYFGEFAMSRIHPSLSERKKALQGS